MLKNKWGIKSMDHEGDYVEKNKPHLVTFHKNNLISQMNF